MATKDFSMNLKKDPHSANQKKTATAPTATGKPMAAAADPEVTNKQKKKTGRPKVKEGEYKTINISIPVSVLEKMEVAKLKYNSNLTAYVNAVIKADLDANYDKYVQIQELMNS